MHTNTNVQSRGALKLATVSFVQHLEGVVFVQKYREKEDNLWATNIFGGCSNLCESKDTLEIRQYLLSHRSGHV